MTCKECCCINQQRVHHVVIFIPKTTHNYPYQYSDEIKKFSDFPHTPPPHQKNRLCSKTEKNKIILEIIKNS